MWMRPSKYSQPVLAIVGCCLPEHVIDEGQQFGVDDGLAVAVGDFTVEENQFGGRNVSNLLRQYSSVH